MAQAILLELIFVFVSQYYLGWNTIENEIIKWKTVFNKYPNRLLALTSYE